MLNIFKRKETDDERRHRIVLLAKDVDCEYRWLELVTIKQKYVPDWAMSRPDEYEIISPNGCWKNIAYIN